MRITRRKAAGLIAASAAVAGLEGQAPPPPKPASTKPTANEDLAEAREDLRLSSAQVARVPLSRTTEPAFRFQA